jgi:Calcineurin-like phosphoesterase
VQFVSDPPISIKISKMKQRVRWLDSLILQRKVDQTQFVLDDGWDNNPEFSFLVIGDTGSGPERTYNPQRLVAEQMLSHIDTCRFVLHTGDVIYLAGSSEYYLDNFIKPYKEFLVGGDQPQRIAYNQMVFKFPIFPVLGNHDYYDLPLIHGFITGLTLPLRRLFKYRLDFDLGWHGSYQGKAYAQAFLDYLCQFRGREDLAHHLDRHYTAKTDRGWCLCYQPGIFTRLPNRYYTFRYGGIDFFALDSNTFNAPQPLPDTQAGETYRRVLEMRRINLEQQKLQMLEMSEKLNPDLPENADQLNDLHTKLEQIEEVNIDINKQLEAHQPPTIDLEQLDWLRQQLIDSWHTEEVRGRIIFFHHPPYVTEATKWQQAQTLAVRYHLRQVLDEVAKAIGALPGARPIVDLVLNGHAHCLEYIRTLATGHADSNLNWIVCGGSGFSLRRQREEGSELFETVADSEGTHTRLVARSHLFVGRNGHGSQKRRPYSFLRIDVQTGTPPRFVVRPYVVERFQQQWSTYQLESLVI